MESGFIHLHRLYSTPGDTQEEISADTPKEANAGNIITPSADSKYLQPGLNINNIDPYAENIFPVLGLDAEFPLPKSDGDYSWEYITSDDMSSRYEGMSGETFAMPEDIYFTLSVPEALGGVYQREIDEYMISRGYEKYGDDYWSENGRVIEANVALWKLYDKNEEETAYTEPLVNFVNGESIEIGSRIAVDALALAHYEYFDGGQPGDLGFVTITCLD